MGPHSTKHVKMKKGHFWASHGVVKEIQKAFHGAQNMVPGTNSLGKFNAVLEKMFPDSCHFLIFGPVRIVVSSCFCLWKLPAYETKVMAGNKVELNCEKTGLLKVHLVNWLSPCTL